ncbi:MAG: YheC/YheD family protein [Cohnella sp.]|nr:YheC/YheD family protein [Cohnella sp.]
MPATSPDSRTAVLEEFSRVLGVLVCERDGELPFAEDAYLRRLSLAAQRFGLSLLVFAPWTWNPRSNSVRGWSWSNREQRWIPRVSELPRVVYDRAWPSTEPEKRLFRSAINRIVAVRTLTFLNSRLPHKGKVGELLSRESKFAALVPPTAAYEGTNSLLGWLREHGNAAFLKPAAGSQGRRVIAFERSAGGPARLAGRTSSNRPFIRSFGNERDAFVRLHRWIGSRAYIMQPLLELRTALGEPFDLRSLLQKNERGRWTITGIAARIGSPGTVTANLHGGGRAEPASKALIPLLGEARARALEQEIRATSFKLVAWFEETFGRFAEIGLDFGVDRSGKLWFLEANSKPGRAAMKFAGDEAAERAVALPLSYASTIMLRPSGRVIHEFDHM